MESTERNASANAIINPLKEDEPTAGLSTFSHCASCKNSKLLGFFGTIDSWSHLKIGSKTIAKRKPLAGQPCHALLAMKNCPRSRDTPRVSHCPCKYFAEIDKERKAIQRSLTEKRSRND